MGIADISALELCGVADLLKAVMCSFACGWVVRGRDFDGARAARILFRSILEQLVTEDSDVSAAELIFGELVTNALRYSNDDVRIDLDHEDDGFHLRIIDSGDCFDPDAFDRPPDAHEGGRGLFIVKSLSDELFVKRHEDQCEVSTRMALRCRSWVA